MDEWGFQVVDVSDPDLPEPLGGYTLSPGYFHPDGIAVKDGYVYLSGSPERWLQGHDARDPAIPPW
jgi:hypothetical protein